MIAVARKGHSAFRSPVSLRTLQKGAFVALRFRVDERDAPAQVQAVHRLKLNVALEVSEILEIFMVASQSDLFGLILRSMESVARRAFGLRRLSGLPREARLPIKLYWHASREADPAHTFLRNEICAATARVVRRR